MFYISSLMSIMCVWTFSLVNVSYYIILDIICKNFMQMIQFAK